MNNTLIATRVAGQLDDMERVAQAVDSQRADAEESERANYYASSIGREESDLLDEEFNNDITEGMEVVQADSGTEFPIPPAPAHELLAALQEREAEARTVADVPQPEPRSLVESTLQRFQNELAQCESTKSELERRVGTIQKQLAQLAVIRRTLADAVSGLTKSEA